MKKANKIIMNNSLKITNNLKNIYKGLLNSLIASEQLSTSTLHSLKHKRDAATNTLHIATYS